MFRFYTPSEEDERTYNPRQAFDEWWKRRRRRLMWRNITAISGGAAITIPLPPLLTDTVTNAHIALEVVALLLLFVGLIGWHYHNK